MRNNLSLGERIFTARRRVNASQDDIAAACDTTRQQVSKWERGKAVPDILETLTLARYTRTPLEWFVEDLVIDLCAPGESNPEPAESRSAAAQGSFFDLWESDGPEGVLLDLVAIERGAAERYVRESELLAS
jgi:transcriptional regulator with XRE-family HTH domain